MSQERVYDRIVYYLYIWLFLHYEAIFHYFGVHEDLIQGHPHVISGIGGHIKIIKAYFNAKSDLGGKGD